jgi:hypothetical protein
VAVLLSGATAIVIVQLYSAMMGLRGKKPLLGKKDYPQFISGSSGVAYFAALL